MYCVRIVRLMVFLFNFTYLVAMTWYIIVKLIEDIMHDVDYSSLDFEKQETVDLYGDNFITKNSLQTKTPF